MKVGMMDIAKVDVARSRYDAIDGLRTGAAG